MEQNTIVLNLEKYEEFIGWHYKIMDLEKENVELKNEIAEIKRILLETNIDEYNIRHCLLEEIKDIEHCNFGLKNKFKLLKVLSCNEMVKFVEIKNEEYARENEDE